MPGRHPDRRRRRRLGLAADFDRGDVGRSHFLLVDDRREAALSRFRLLLVRLERHVHGGQRFRRELEDLGRHHDGGHGGRRDCGVEEFNVISNDAKYITINYLVGGTFCRKKAAITMVTKSHTVCRYQL